MPKKTTAYSCEWGCKSRVLTSRQAMMNHEDTCFHNPDTKSCATCQHIYQINGLNHCAKKVGSIELTTECPDWDELNPREAEK